jgi:hypothetical protein
MPPNPASPTKPGVTINIRVPMALHRQLRLQALRQDMMMKDAVVAAIEAWVAPAKRQGSALPVDQMRAQGGQEVLAILDRALLERLPWAQARAKAQAYLDGLEIPSL